MSEKEVELDPEFLDVLIQSISVLLNVATLGTAWLMIRDRAVAHPAHFADSDAIRQQLRTFRRGLEDTFEAVQAVLRILEEGSARGGQPSPLNRPTRFGVSVMLTGEEFGRAQQFLGSLENSATQARTAARNLQLMMNVTNMGAAHNVVFSPEQLNAQLNSILFESPSLGDAMTKLRLAQQHAEDFISDVERALRPN
jgi:hypothetical protein